MPSMDAMRLGFRQQGGEAAAQIGTLAQNHGIFRHPAATPPAQLGILAQNLWVPLFQKINKLSIFIEFCNDLNDMFIVLFR